jgi:hypothetical protein
MSVASPRSSRTALTALLLLLLLGLLAQPAAAAGLSVSLPTGSAVKIGAATGLSFTVTNTSETEGLSRLTLLFPSGYRVTSGAPPPGWALEPASSQGGDVSFRTTDEASCTGAIAPGKSLVFQVEVVAPASASVAPESLAGAQGEQSCRGVLLDPPAALPSWDRLGIEATIAAGPPVLGLGGDVLVTMTVMNLSTVELADVSALLGSTGTGGVSGLAGPTPGSLRLAPGAAGNMTWTGRATSPGTVSFSGQAIGGSVTSSSVQSDPLSIGDLEVSLSLAPEQVASGQSVQVQMIVTNRGPLRVADVIPPSLAFRGTAVSDPASGPTPASLTALDPGESSTFVWEATVSGDAGDTYAFSGWAAAEGQMILSAEAVSNAGVIAQQQVAGGADNSQGSAAVSGGGSASSADGGTGTTGASTASTTSGTGSTPPLASASLSFVGVGHNGGLVGGAQFSTAFVKDLKIVVGWNNTSGSHTQRIDLFAPDGALYQQLSTPFGGAGSVEAQLLVAGTWITQYSLFGAWRAEVFLDSARIPITSGAFVLNP